MKTNQDPKANSTSLPQLFQTLVEIVAKLRSPEGCPWDREQTQQSLTQYALEEAYELCEAIETGDQTEVKEELGDYLFQVILQAQVAEDLGHFNLSSVIHQLNEKMIRRHPHVFGNVKADNSKEVWKNWEKLKSAEKTKPLFSYPRSLPALQASYKIGVKTEGFKFDWPSPHGVLDKIKEEFLEVEDAFADWAALSEASSPSKTSSSPTVSPATRTELNAQLSPELKALQHEIGDLLFSAAQLARHLQLEPEQCLREANRRFETRFNWVLKLAGDQYGPTFSQREAFSTLTLEQKENLWKQAKLICSGSDSSAKE